MSTVFKRWWNTRGGREITRAPLMKAQPQVDTSTWSGWFKSFFQRAKLQQVRSPIPSFSSQAHAFSPFGRSGQRRSYSTGTLARLQEPIAVSLSPDSKLISQRQAQDILRKLKEENPWGSSEGDLEVALQSPLGKEISTFLNENEIDAIEQVVIELLGEQGRFVGEVYGQEILIKMLEKNDELISKLFPIMEKNCDKVWRDLLDAILRRLPSEKLLQAKNMIKSFFSEVSIYYLPSRYKYKDMSRLFTDDISQFIQILKIICNKISPFVGKNKKWGEEYDEFVSNLANTITEKLSEDDFKALLEELLKKPNTVGFNVFNKLILSKPGLKNFIDNYIKQSLEEEEGGRAIAYRASHSPEFKKCVVNYIKKERDLNIGLMPVDFLSTSLDGSDFIKVIFGFDNTYEHVPSYRHLVKYYKDFADWDYVEIIKNPIFKNVIQDIIRKEKELVDAGYDVYYHGGIWDNNFLSDLYIMLYAYKSGKDVKDFIFLHFDDPVLGKVSKLFFESEEKTRERLLFEGNAVPKTSKLDDVLGIGRSTLFLAKYLFGNLSKPGCSPIGLMLENFNWGKGNISIKEIFSMFDLKKKHAGLGSYGRLVQVAVPKKNIDKCIYRSMLGCHGQQEALSIPGLGTTNDMNIISDYVNKNPQEELEFILIMTRDPYGGHSLDSGMKMFSYNLVEPEKMAQFKEEEKDEFSKIEKDLVEENTQEKAGLGN
jgi:hypothetical protein